MVGNSDLLGFWPVLGRRHVEKLRAWAENGKTELGGLLGGKFVRPKTFSPKLRNFFTFCILADPHGREIAKYWVFRHFWPRAALGT